HESPLRDRRRGRRRPWPRQVPSAGPPWRARGRRGLRRRRCCSEQAGRSACTRPPRRRSGPRAGRCRWGCGSPRVEYSRGSGWRHSGPSVRPLPGGCYVTVAGQVLAEPSAGVLSRRGSRGAAEAGTGRAGAAADSCSSLRGVREGGEDDGQEPWPRVSCRRFGPTTLRRDTR
ncbi:unnamed protein product, partial [Prorocentrum cordatum]